MERVNIIPRHRISIDLEDVDHDRIVGSFSAESWERRNDSGYLFRLDEYDIGVLEKDLDHEVKHGQQIFRYETRIMFGICRPFILVDFSLKIPRVYFLKSDSFEGITDKIRFETKGVKVRYAWIFEDSKDEFDVIEHPELMRRGYAISKQY